MASSGSWGGSSISVCYCTGECRKTGRCPNTSIPWTPNPYPLSPQPYVAPKIDYTPSVIAALQQTVALLQARVAQLEAEIEKLKRGDSASD